MALSSAGADRGDVAVNGWGPGGWAPSISPFSPSVQRNQQPLQAGDPVETNDPCTTGGHASQAWRTHASSCRPPATVALIVTEGHICAQTRKPDLISFDASHQSVWCSEGQELQETKIEI